MFKKINRIKSGKTEKVKQNEWSGNKTYRRDTPQIIQQNITILTGIHVERTEEQSKSQVDYLKVHCNDFNFFDLAEA